MLKDISGLLSPNIDINKLRQASQEWITSIDKKDSLTTKKDVILALYDGILHLLDSGYSYADVVNKLKEQFQFSITSHTLKRYLQDIKDLRLKAEKEFKKAETKAKLAEAKAIKSLSSTNTITIDSVVESSSFLSDEFDLDSPKQALIASSALNLVTASVNSEITTSDLKSVVPKLANQSESPNLDSVTSNKKIKSAKPKSVVPRVVPPIEDSSTDIKSADSLPVDDSSSDVNFSTSLRGNDIPMDQDPRYSHLTPAQRESAKHFNRY